MLKLPPVPRSLLQAFVRTSVSLAVDNFCVVQIFSPRRTPKDAVSLEHEYHR